MLDEWGRGEFQELLQNCDFTVFSEYDEMLAQVTSNYIAFLNHCFRTAVCHANDNTLLLLWVVYLYVVVI